MGLKGELGAKEGKINPPPQGVQEKNSLPSSEK